MDRLDISLVENWVPGARSLNEPIFSSADPTGKSDRTFGSDIVFSQGTLSKCLGRKRIALFPEFQFMPDLSSPYADPMYAAVTIDVINNSAITDLVMLPPSC